MSSSYVTQKSKKCTLHTITDTLSPFVVLDNLLKLLRIQSNALCTLPYSFNYIEMNLVHAIEPSKCFPLQLLSH